ncbi:unnamed protein product, partial [Musa textilis]
ADSRQAPGLHDDLGEFHRASLASSANFRRTFRRTSENPSASSLLILGWFRQLLPTNLWTSIELLNS